MPKRTVGEHCFDLFNVVLMLCVVVFTLYPFIYIVFGSLSDATLLAAYSGILLRPLGFSTEAYTAVLTNEDIWVGYKNTIFYVILGTSMNMAITILSAYVVSRRNLYFKRALLFIAVFTMYFSGGLIPTYLQVQRLGLLNTRWALLLPGVMSTYNMIVLRTAFLNVSPSLEESAKLDGASELTILIRIIVPLCIPTIAVLILFYAVGHWNSWFNALIYIRKRELYPLQIFLREILLSGSESDMLDASDFAAMQLKRTIKYSTIVVSTVPILCLYPFLQKYFVKGVMVGAIKG